MRWLGRGAVGIEDILIRGNGLHEGYVFGVRLGLGLGLGLGMKPGRGGRVGGRGPGFMPCLSFSGLRNSSNLGSHNALPTAVAAQVFMAV